MEYTLQCVKTNAGWRWRVTLWYGRVAYHGQRTYERHQDAVKAAKASGATERPEKG